MSCIFLVRNFLSVKTAYAIFQQYRTEENILFSVEADDIGYFDRIKSTIPDGITILATEQINWLFLGSNYLLNFGSLLDVQKKISSLYREHQVEELFVHYPVHEKDAVYVKVAKQMGVKISFYEEGSCFYTGNRGRKKDFISQCKHWVKQFTLMAMGIHRGYGAKADEWFSLLPLKGISSKRIKISYMRLKEEEIKYLFLSRPVTLDYPSVPLSVQVKAIAKFLARVPSGETLFIKFHPRESNTLQQEIMTSLNNLSHAVRVVKLDVDIAAEDIVFNMPSGGEVCGFDSSTLIYGESINNKVRYSSVLKEIYEYDEFNELENLYFNYKCNFNHIEFI